MAYKHSHSIMGLRWLLSTYNQGGQAVAGFRYNNNDDTAVCDGKLEKRNIIGLKLLNTMGCNDRGSTPQARLIIGVDMRCNGDGLQECIVYHDSRLVDLP
jgi:hypothetical protein